MAQLPAGILAGYNPGNEVLSAFSQKSNNAAHESHQRVQAELESLLHVLDVGLLSVHNQLAAMPLDHEFAQALRSHRYQLGSYQGTVQNLLANIHHTSGHTYGALMNQVSHIVAELQHALHSRPAEKADAAPLLAFTPQMEAQLEAMPIMMTLGGMMAQVQMSAAVVRTLHKHSRDIETAFADFNLIVKNVAATDSGDSELVLGETFAEVREAVSKAVDEEISAGPDKVDATAKAAMVESRFAARWERIKDSIDHVRTGMNEKAHNAQERFLEGRKRMQKVFHSHVVEPVQSLQAQLPKYQENCAHFFRESAEEAAKRMQQTQKLIGGVGALIEQINKSFSHVDVASGGMGLLNTQLMTQCASALNETCGLSAHFGAQVQQLNQTMQMIDAAQKGVRDMARGDASGLNPVVALLGSEQAHEAVKQVHAFQEKYLPSATLSLFATALPRITNAMQYLGFGAKEGPSKGPPRPPS